MIAGIALAAGAKRAIGFLKGVPWQIYAIIALVVAAWALHGVYQGKLKDARDNGYTQGAGDTRAAFYVAQAKADAKQRAKVERINAGVAKINKETSNVLLAVNDSIDARAAKLRLRHDAAARERARRPGAVPATGGAAAGTCPPAQADGLSWGPALDLMTEAAKNLAQLNAILEWERRQSALAAEPAK